MFNVSHIKLLVLPISFFSEASLENRVLADVVFDDHLLLFKLFEHLVDKPVIFCALNFARASLFIAEE